MGILQYKRSRRGSAAYCASADLNFCNGGDKPTFRTKTREEILDLTLVNRCAWDRVVGWHVSNVPSFSDHMRYIRLQVKSRIRKQAKFFVMFVVRAGTSMLTNSNKN